MPIEPISGSMSEIWSEPFTETLKQCYGTLKEKNHRYSLRAFAKRLELSPGTLSELLRGDMKGWSLTPERALVIVDKLDLTARRKKSLKTLIGFTPKPITIPLDKRNYDLLTDWRLIPIMMAFDLPLSERTPEALAKRLGEPQEFIESSIGKLIRRGVLAQAPNGQVVRREIFWETADGVASDLVKKSHEQALSTAARALEAVSPEGREFSNLTFVGSKKKLSRLKEEVRRFQDRVLALMDTDDNDDVFQISIAAFPVNFGAYEGEKK